MKSTPSNGGTSVLSQGRRLKEKNLSEPKYLSFSFDIPHLAATIPLVLYVVFAWQALRSGLLVTGQWVLVKGSG